MQVRERIAAIIVVGVMIFLAILIHNLTASDRTGVEAAAVAAAATEVGWTETSAFGDTARDHGGTR